MAIVVSSSGVRLRMPTWGCQSRRWGILVLLLASPIVGIGVFDKDTNRRGFSFEEGTPRTEQLNGIGTSVDIETIPEYGSGTVDIEAPGEVNDLFEADIDAR